MQVEKLITDLGRVHYIHHRATIGSPTLVFFTSFGGDASYYNFKNLIDKLPQHTGWLAVDSLGYGFSYQETMERSAANIVRNYQDLIDHLQLESLILIGHSMGAVYAQLLAEKNLERVQRLVFIEPTHLGILSDIKAGEEALREEMASVRQARQMNKDLTLEFLEAVNPHLPKSLKLDNARLYSQAYASDSLVTELDKGEETLKLASRPSQALLNKLILLARPERKADYQRSIYSSASQVFYFGDHHFLHWFHADDLLNYLF